MKILYRYIGLMVLGGTGIVLVAVLGLDLFINFLTEINDIGTGDYHISQALMFATLQLPHDLYLLFPMIVLLGGLTSLGVLAGHHELMVMRASGVSLGQISYAVLGTALVMIILAGFAGEVLSPLTQQYANNLKNNAINHGQAISTSYGSWIHEGGDFIHIKVIADRYHMIGVTDYQFDAQRKLLSAAYAKTVQYQDKHWVLYDVTKTIFSENKTTTQHLPKMVWNLQLKPNLLNVATVWPEEMSLGNLWRYTHYLTQNKLQAGDFQLAFWKRIFQPLATLIMILLALPFVFGSTRTITMGLRVLIGISFGFGFYVLNQFLGQFGLVYQVPPVLAAFAPILIFALLAYGLMRRSQ